MTGFKKILMTGAAVLALTACSSDRGPGQIGSADDIIIRNAGEPKAPPPKPLDVAAATAGTVAAENTASDGVTAAPAPAVEQAAESVPAAAETPAPAVSAPTASTTEVAAPTAPAAPAAMDPVTEVKVETPAAPAAEAVPAEAPAPAAMKNISMAGTPAATAEPAPVAAASSTPAPEVPASVPAPAESSSAVDLSMAALQTGDKAKVKAIQEELKKAGLYKGKTNGKVNTETLNALVRYQSAQGTLATAPVPASTTSTPAASTSTVSNASATPAPLPPSGTAPAAVSAPQTPAPAAAATSALTANTPMTDPALIRAVQEKLKAQGLLPSVSGAMDSATLNALVKYQMSNGLTPGALNLDTVKKLGVVQ